MAGGCSLRLVPANIPQRQRLLLHRTPFIGLYGHIEASEQ